MSMRKLTGTFECKDGAIMFRFQDTEKNLSRTLLCYYISPPSTTPPPDCTCDSVDFTWYEPGPIFWTGHFRVNIDVYGSNLYIGLNGQEFPTCTGMMTGLKVVPSLDRESKVVYLGGGWVDHAIADVAGVGADVGAGVVVEGKVMDNGHDDGSADTPGLSADKRQVF